MQSFCDTKAAIEICPPAPQVTTGLCVASGCDTITCVTKTITFTQTPTGCDAAVVYTDDAGAVLSGVKEVPCPQKVEVVNLTPPPPSPTPITITGADCAGAPVAATGLPQQIIQTVPHPTAVQPVKICGPIANLKIEFSETLLFSASTEQSIYRIKEYNEDTGTWVTRYENLDGTLFTGALPPDLNRVSALVNVTRTQVLGCAAGVPYAMRETARFDAETGALESEVVDWVDSAGVVQTTAPADFVLGECKPCEVTKHFEFLGYTTPETTGLQPKVLGLHQGVDGADFTQSLVGDFEFYLVVDGAAQLGNGAGAGYAAEYPLSFSSLQAVAEWLNVHPANTAPKDNWIVAGTAGNQSLVIQGSIGGVAPNHAWQDMVLAHYDAGSTIDYNIFKTSPSSADVEIAIPASCKTIEVLKELDCNRNLTLFGFELDGTPIAGFDAKNLVSECGCEVSTPVGVVSAWG